jgi:hypothetical protein
MSDHYILNDDHTVTPTDLMTWAAEFEKRDNRRVDRTELPDGTVISTVFLGLDHSYGEGPPLLFETMIFPSWTNYEEEYCERYSTWDEAVAGHERAVAQAIEARRAATGNTDAVADESPVGEAASPNPDPGPPGVRS